MLDADEMQARTLAQALHTEAWRDERIANHYRATIFTALGLLQLWHRSGFDHDHLTIMPALLIAWGVFVGLGNFTWLRKSFPSWYPSVQTALDVTIGTAATFAVYAHTVEYDEPGLQAVMARGALGLFLLLALNMIRFSWRHSLWSGVCVLVALAFLRLHSGTMAERGMMELLLVISMVGLLVYTTRRHRGVTERLMLDLRRAQEQHTTSTSALVAGITHEMNSPLGSLASNAQLADRAVTALEGEIGDPTPRARRALTALTNTSVSSQGAVERILTVIKALRSFVRLDEAEVKRVDIREGLDSCIELLSSTTAGRIEITRRYDDIPDIECRPGQLNQTFMHVLNNAVQAIAEAGSITANVSTKGDFVLVAVADTGCGIAPEKLEGIYDPKLRRSGDRARMGFGLAISHDTIEGHGGSIEIESTVGEGTTVSLLLPIT